MSGKSEFIFVSGRVSGHSKDFRPGGQAARGSGSRSDLRERDTGLKPTPTGRSSSGASAAALRFVGSVMMNNSLDRTLGNSTVPGGALCRSSAWGWGGGSSACRELRPEALQFRCGGRRAASWGVALIFLFRRQAHGKGLDTLLSSFFLKLLFKGAFPHFGRCGGGGSAALGLSVFWVALREGPAACTPSLCWAGPPGAPTAGGGRPRPAEAKRHPRQVRLGGARWPGLSAPGCGPRRWWPRGAWQVCPARSSDPPFTLWGVEGVVPVQAGSTSLSAPRRTGAPGCSCGSATRDARQPAAVAAHAIIRSCRTQFLSLH